MHGDSTRDALPRASTIGVFLIFLKLGLTSFGGPIAHLGYYRHEFVERRKWLDETAYAELVALCNFLPGPASSQIGMALGISQTGLPGGIAAWMGFTLPSALLLIAFAYGFEALGLSADSGALHGLKVVAVAVIAQAVWSMGKTLCPDRLRASLAIVATLIVFWWSSALGQIVAVLVGALVGAQWLTPVQNQATRSLNFPVKVRTASAAMALFFGLLILLPALALATGSHALALADSFYRTGSLVFGGGHVVLPLLRNEVVPPGWVSDDVFLAGYGAAQAVPGPLFTFSAYLGTVMSPGPNGIAGGLLCLVAIFLPGFLLVVGALPFWTTWRSKQSVRAALGGVNAAVVGILLAALYDPVWTTSIRSARDMGLALAAFGLLMFWKVPPVIVVVATALASAALGLR